MSQSVKEFVRQSGIDVQRVDPHTFRDVPRPTGTFRRFENSNNEFNNKKIMPPIPSRLKISNLEPFFHDPIVVSLESTVYSICKVYPITLNSMAVCLMNLSAHPYFMC